MNTKNKSTVKFGEKNFTVQNPKNREPYIEVMRDSIRRKITVSMVEKLNDLETIEGWERLYQEHINN